ncbi:MAG: hypothetical protein VX642_06060 [Bdellovibrionota bacterium]|nr:hypothetical protein [Bdellovibrionota bacterium]
MKVLFKNIQGLIFLSIAVAFSANANAQMYGSMWGTGFSPGMQGCMADTEAYDKYGDIKEVKVYNKARLQLEIAENELRKVEDKASDQLERVGRLRDSDGENDAKRKRWDKLEAFLEFRGDQVYHKIDVKVKKNGDGGKLTHEAEVKECAAYVSKNEKDEIEKSIKALKALSAGASWPTGIFTNTESASRGTSGYEAFQPDSALDLDVQIANYETWAGKFIQLPDGVSYNDIKDVCSDDPDKLVDAKKFCDAKREVSAANANKYKSCEKYVKDYVEVAGLQDHIEQFIEVTETDVEYYEEEAQDAISDAEIEGKWCADCAYSGYRQKEDRDSLLTRSIIGAGAGLLGQYLGLRAYKSVQNNAINMAAKAGHTMQPVPNFNLYSGLGLSAIGTISGLVNGSYMCGGGTMGAMGGLTGMGGMGFGGVYGMNNPYAMQMAMMGQGGAFGYPFGQNMMSPMGGMYYGGMGPMGVQTPFHMMGQMNPAMMSAYGPYASMYGPYAQTSPMLGLGMTGMAGMPGANLGLTGGMNPYGMYSPYAMMSPFGGLSAYAGMGGLASNPWNMMQPGMFNTGGGIMSCIQAPCQGNLFNPYGMSGFGNIGGGSQQLQLQMQMLQQQQQQQMAYYQQLQQQTQQRMQAAQQLTQLQSQMAQLNQQAAQLASQAGIGGGIGVGVGGGLGIPSIYGSGSLGIGLGLGGSLGGSLYGGFSTGWPYTGYGLGQISPNVPSTIGYGGSR